jgi:hypothetical protein
MPDPSVGDEYRLKVTTFTPEPSISIKRKKGMEPHE